MQSFMVAYSEFIWGNQNKKRIESFQLKLFRISVMLYPRGNLTLGAVILTRCSF